MSYTPAELAQKFRDLKKSVDDKMDETKKAMQEEINRLEELVGVNGIKIKNIENGVIKNSEE